MRLIAGLALAAALVACTPEEAVVTPSPSPVPAPVVEQEPSPTAAERTEPPFVANTDTDFQEASGSGLTVVNVRVDPQDGFDRVIFELDGEGAPGWVVGYVPEPLAQGSGSRVAIEGEAFLEVRLEGVGYPFDTGIEEFEADRVSDPDTGVVEEVWLGGVFEGSYDAFVGLLEVVPFRVYGLGNPARVVIETVHPT